MNCPADVLIIIFKDLSIKNLNKCRLVCRNWNRVINKTPNLFWGKYGECANFNKMESLKPKERKRVLELFNEYRILIKSVVLYYHNRRFYGLGY